MTDTSQFLPEPETVGFNQRQKFIDLLMQQPEGNAAPRSRMGALLPGVSMVIGALMQKRLREEQAQWQEQRQALLSDQLQGFLKKYAGSPGGVELPGPPEAEKGPPVSQPVAGNPHAAVVEALTSRYPEMRAIGASELPKLLTANKPPQMTYHTVGNNLVGTLNNPTNPDTPTVKELYRGQPQFTTETLTDPDGKRHTVQRDSRTGEVKNVFPAGTNVSIDTQTNKAVLAKMDDKFAAAAQAVTAGREQIASSERLYALASDPATVSGFGAGVELGFKALGKKLGWADSENSVAKGQALLAGIAKQTLAAVPQLKGAISDKERPFLEQASAGAFNWTPEALRHLANLAQVAAHNQAMDAFRQYQSIGTLEGSSPFMAMNPMPPVQWKMDSKRFSPMEGVQDYFTANDSLGVGAPAAPTAPPASGEKSVTIGGRKIPVRILP